jgi:23S rRNA pseudouridine955/2504/2580 synthase
LSSKVPAKPASTDSPSVTFQEVSSEQSGQRIDNFLLSRLKGVPKSRIYRIIRKGEVRVNKKRIKPEYKLQTGDLVRIPPVRVAEPRQQIPPSEALQELLQNAVLFQDECLLIINKPAGLPVHAGTGVKTGLIEALRYIYPELSGLELAHRIDKGTSGCLLLAKNAKSLKILSAQFKGREVQKTYHALVEANWPEQISEVDAPLLRQEAGNGERYVVVSNEGKSAQTDFAILERFTDATLIKASPRTGRTHQIRVHTQYSGCPIIGDQKYSQDVSRKQFADRGIKRLCLHAAELSFTHPESGQQFTISAPWDAQFSAAVSLLRQAGD